jgi:hypothetical protein
MWSHVHVLKYDASTARLVRISTVPIGDPYASHDLHGYGAAGIAIADLNQTGQTNPPPEIIVTTLNGELVVFGQTNGMIDPAPLFQTIVEGQLGAFNSIVVGDYDPLNLDKPEVYIASSTGIRKFYVQ